MLEINPDEDIAPQYIEAVVGQKVQFTKPTDDEYNIIWMLSYGPFNIVDDSGEKSHVEATSIYIDPVALDGGGIYTCCYLQYIAYVELKVFCKFLKIQFLIDEQEK